MAGFNDYCDGSWIDALFDIRWGGRLNGLVLKLPVLHMNVITVSTVITFCTLITVCIVMTVITGTTLLYTRSRLVIALVLVLAVLHMVPRLFDRTYTVTTTGHHTRTSPTLVAIIFCQVLRFINLNDFHNCYAGPGYILPQNCGHM